MITFIDGSRRLVDILKINLYILATGPYHQDFAVNDKGVRVSFNLKIAQLVKVRIVTDQAEMIPREKEYPGDRFAFTLRSIVYSVTLRWGKK